MSSKKIMLVFMLLFMTGLISTDVLSLKATLFYESTCPYCKKEIEFLNSIASNYSLELDMREVSTNPDNMALYKEKLKELSPDRSGVPALMIGNRLIIGFSDRIAGDIRSELILQKENETKNCKVCNVKTFEFTDDARISMLLIVCAVLLFAIIVMIRGKEKIRRKIQRNKRKAPARKNDVSSRKKFNQAR